MEDGRIDVVRPIYLLKTTQQYNSVRIKRIKKIREVLDYFFHPDKKRRKTDYLRSFYMIKSQSQPQSKKKL